MDNPNLRRLTIAHPDFARMTSEEAREAAGIAGMFVATATIDRKNSYNLSLRSEREICNAAAQVTREVADFAQAVAVFKNR